MIGQKEGDLASLNLNDVNTILRVLRSERDRLTGVRQTMEARLATLGDGEAATIRREIVMLDVELAGLYRVVGKLWHVAWGKATT